jgi:hypothetical protein
MTRARFHWALAAFVLLAPAAICQTVTWRAYNAKTETMDVIAAMDGPKHAVRVAVLGEGFTQSDYADPKSFDSSVSQLYKIFALNSATNDPTKPTAKWWYGDHAANDFSFCEVRLESKCSGISRDEVNANGTSTNKVTRDTVLGATYNGDTSNCFLENEADTRSRAIDTALRACGTVDRLLVILNFAANDFGGCTTESIMYTAKDVTANIFAHELGHALAGLDDEYEAPPGGPSTAKAATKNCSVSANVDDLPWKQDLLPQTTVTVDQGDFGAFTGCGGFETGIYRPAFDCLMNAMDQTFCRLCTRICDECLARLRNRGSFPADFETLILNVGKGKPWVMRSLSSHGEPFRSYSCDDTYWQLTVDGRDLGTVATAADPAWRIFRRTGSGKFVEQKIEPPADRVIAVSVPAPVFNKLTPKDLQNLSLQRFELRNNLTFPLGLPKNGPQGSAVIENIRLDVLAPTIQALQSASSAVSPPN